MAETARKRHKIEPSYGLATQFTPDRQPAPELKSQGKQKAGLLRRLMDIQLNGKGEKLDEIREHLAALTGLPPEQVSQLTLEAVSHLRQIEKAILSGDTYAYNSYQNREYGNPTTTVNAEVKQMIMVVTPEDAERLKALEE